VELSRILQNLATARPIFHSEADFQHALAWSLHNEYPGSEIRLEFRPFPEERFYLDIWCRGPDESLAIELKYLTRDLDVEVEGERFLLKNQGAQDLGRHDVIKDIVRVERITREVSGTRGYVIALTNDASYWKQSLRADTVDASFRLHEGRLLEGTLSWSELAGAGTTSKRTDPLALTGRYSIRWNQYSILGPGTARDFRYLQVTVGKERAEG
jgi:hypothetical protein